MSHLLTHLDDYGGWLAAVVAGLAALGWLIRRAFRIVSGTAHRAREVARKIDRLDELASLELQTNGGGSMKDCVALVPILLHRVTAVEIKLDEHLKKKGEGS